MVGLRGDVRQPYGNIYGLHNVWLMLMATILNLCCVIGADVVIFWQSVPNI